MKYIVTNCPACRTSYYPNGKVVNYECGESTNDILCQDIAMCPIKLSINRIWKVASKNKCEECEKGNYNDGCLDNECDHFNILESLKFLGIAGVKNK